MSWNDADAVADALTGCPAQSWRTTGDAISAYSLKLLGDRWRTQLSHDRFESGLRHSLSHSFGAFRCFQDVARCACMHWRWIFKSATKTNPKSKVTRSRWLDTAHEIIGVNRFHAHQMYLRRMEIERHNGIVKNMPDNNDDDGNVEHRIYVRIILATHAHAHNCAAYCVWITFAM